MTQEVFGRLDGIDSALLLQDTDLPESRQPERRTAYSQEGNMLWEYGSSGTIGGIRVADADRGLPIDGAELLENAFELHAEPKLFVAWISPDMTDGISRYEELLARAGRKEIVISDEDRQYDQSRSAFMVLVRYDELEYRLHGRFAYLREEAQQNGKEIS